jgi:RimJ/RimL family protein N-acetyltransferase
MKIDLACGKKGFATEAQKHRKEFAFGKKGLPRISQICTDWSVRPQYVADRLCKCCRKEPVFTSVPLCFRGKPVFLQINQ